MMNNPVNKRKILNDPVHGFIALPNDLVYDVIEHSYFQRLRRIKQLGLTHLVYPGALHTRFSHALGAMHLMVQAIEVLKQKGIAISQEESEAAVLAILLHDIGHGPFSHALEHSIVDNISHEEISSLFMEELNTEFQGRLDMAISIFKDTHSKKFLHQLVAGQLDVDRLDYLSRDSFFTGVSEGIIGTERIIKMLNVKENELVVDEKGIYSIEKFIVSRRLMYWQVYLHKTVLSAENMMIQTLRRAKELAAQGVELFATPSLHTFLYNSIGIEKLRSDHSLLSKFADLDDADIFSSIKVWEKHPDPILSKLSASITNRKLFRIEIQSEPFAQEYILQKKEKVIAHFNIPERLSSYFVFSEEVTNNMYDPKHDKINILLKNGDVKDISHASDQLNQAFLSRITRKYILCYPKYL